MQLSYLRHRLVRIHDIAGMLFTHILQGRTCLHVAATLNSSDAMYILLDGGADPNIGDDHVSLKPAASFWQCMFPALDSINMPSSTFVYLQCEFMCTWACQVVICRQNS